MEFNNGTTVTGGGLRGTFSVTRAEGGLFAPTLDVAGECVVFAKKTAAGIDLEAPCTFTESTTDRWYWVTSRRTGDMAARGVRRSFVVPANTLVS